MRTRIFPHNLSLIDRTNPSLPVGKRHFEFAICQENGRRMRVIVHIARFVRPVMRFRNSEIRVLSLVPFSSPSFLLTTLDAAK